MLYVDDNGVEATRAIRALPGPAGMAPILAVTANTLDEQLQSYAEAGMDDGIAKPVDMAELLAKVVAWADAAQEPPAAASAARRDGLG